MKLTTRFFTLTLIIISGSLLFTQCADTEQPDRQQQAESRLLVFSKTEGFRHSSIPTGVEALKAIGEEQGYRIDHSEDAALFNPDTLSLYDAVIFLSTTGNILNDEQQDAFEGYIGNGGGYLGIHAAADTEYEWPWYNRLVGAYFQSHPQVQEADIMIADSDHPATAPLPESWSVTDEWYNYKSIQPHLTVLGRLDESSYEGGENGDDHPIIWYHEEMGGRAFYTGRGHTEESFGEPEFRAHLLGAMQYVLGE